MDLPLRVIIFQSTKWTKSFIIKCASPKQQNQPKRNEKMSKKQIDININLE
jgi:hypothetical protein